MLFRAGARCNVAQVPVFRLDILYMRVQRSNNKRRRIVQRRRLLVVLVFKRIQHIWEVFEQFGDHLFLFFGCRPFAGQHFHTFARSDVFHIAACAFSPKKAGFLDQPRHALQPFLLPQHLWKRDLSIRPQYLLIAFSAHLLVRLRVNIRVRSKNVIADVLLNRLLEKQFTDTIPEHTEDGFERFSKDFRQEVACIFTLQIAAIELNCFVNEVILRRAAVQLVVVLHLAPRRVIQPNGMAAFFLCFYGVHPLQKQKAPK